MAGLNPTLEELRVLVRATHLFARNYKATFSPDHFPDERRHAIESAFLRLEEALINAMRKGVKDLHEGTPYQHDKFIHSELQMLDRPDWREALAVGKAVGL